MFKNIYDNFVSKEMFKYIDDFKKKINKFSVNKFNIKLISDLNIFCYGRNIKLINLCKINLKDNILIISLFDKNIVNLVEKSILLTKLDFNFSRKGNDIILNIPPLTNDRRNNILKLLKKELEFYKIFIRNKRKDFKKKILYFLKNKELSLNEKFFYDKKIQYDTDKCINELNNLYLLKKKEIDCNY